VSYGGNFYAIVDVQENFPGLEHFSAGKLIEWGRAFRANINQKYTFVHPEDPTIKGCSHILWTGSVINKIQRHVMFFMAIKRSTAVHAGTGTSARMAQWYAKGKLKKEIGLFMKVLSGLLLLASIKKRRPSCASRQSGRVSKAGQGSMGTTPSLLMTRMIHTHTVSR
jgi:4-hydroxyproline epimerase